MAALPLCRLSQQYAPWQEQYALLDPDLDVALADTAGCSTQ
jgi:hypothetical protein